MYHAKFDDRKFRTRRAEVYEEYRRKFMLEISPNGRKYFNLKKRSDEGALGHNRAKFGNGVILCGNHQYIRLFFFTSVCFSPRLRRAWRTIKLFKRRFFFRQYKM